METSAGSVHSGHQVLSVDLHAGNPRLSPTDGLPARDAGPQTL